MCTIKNVPSKVRDFPLALSYDDVTLVPKYSTIDSRSQVNLSTKISKYLSLKIPLISTKMDTVTGVEMAIAIGKLGGMGILPRFDTPDAQAGQVSQVKKSKVVVAAAVGVKDGFLERAEMLVKAGVDCLNIDVAHGHMQKTIQATKILKNKFGERVTIISGITATYECAVDLYRAGADSLLVGIGGSPICTTRVETGFGLPIFSSLLQTAKAARKFKKTFMSDSGTRTAGDIVKALAAGASGIVAGYIFAGTDEAPGEVVEIDGQMYKTYNGSASHKEKTNHVKKFGIDKSETYVKQIEGVEALTHYKGPLAAQVERLLAGVRSGLSYAGARNIPELWKKAEFVRITGSGLVESGNHDVMTVRN